MTADESAAPPRQGVVSGLHLSAAASALLLDGPVPFVVRGGSMRPGLPDGARVQVGPARVLLPGDVAVFRFADGRLVAHRVLGLLPGRSGWRLAAKGDAAPGFDDLVPAERVLGKADVTVPIRARLAALCDLGVLLARGLRRRIG